MIMHRLGFRGRFACLLVWVICATLTLHATGHAQTPRIQGQGAAAAGMGNAFAAQADDASALHYNAAGMTQLSGVQTMVGSSVIGGNTNFRNAAGQTTTGDRNGSVAWPPPSHFYATANLKDLGFNALGNMTVGIGVNNPFGSLSRYPNDGPLRTAVTFVQLPLIDIKPTIAYKLNEQLSFGLGADIYTFSSMFGEGHVEQRSVSPISGTNVELNGSDTAAGFNVSMLYAPLRNADGKPLANIGIVYRSQATLHLQGEFRSNGTLLSDAKATLVLPQVISGAIALWPVRDKEREWKLEMDVDYVGWKSNRNLDVHLSTSLPVIGNTISQPQQWTPAYTVMVGTEYKWLKLEQLPEWEIALRGGYMNQQTQVPDSTFNPGIPSTNVHVPGIGLGVFCKENGTFLGMKCGNLGIGTVRAKGIGLDLSYQAAFFENRTIAGSQVATNPPGAVNGTYQSFIHVGNISLRFIF